jgi:uncharacterized membrane protein (UPF0127 family)
VTVRRVYNKTRNAFIVSELEVAETAWNRMKGLLGRSARDFSVGKGLWLRPAQGIHTIGMVFPIDVAYLDAQGRVLRTYHQLSPFRVAAITLRTRCVLELPPGTLKRTGTEVGDLLEIRSATE